MCYSAKVGKYNVHRECAWVQTMYGLILLLEVKIINSRRQIWVILIKSCRFMWITKIGVGYVILLLHHSQCYTMKKILASKLSEPNCHWIYSSTSTPPVIMWWSEAIDSTLIEFVCNLCYLSINKKSKPIRQGQPCQYNNKLWDS